MLLKKKVPTFSNSFDLLTLLTTIIFILDFIVFYFNLNIDVLLLFLPVMVSIINYNDLEKKTAKLFDPVGFFVLMIAIFCDYITPVSMNIVFSLGMFALTISFYAAYIKRQRQVSNIIARNYFHIFFVVLSSVSFLKFLTSINNATLLEMHSVIEFFLFSILVFYVVLTVLHFLMFYRGTNKRDMNKIVVANPILSKERGTQLNYRDKLDVVEENSSSNESLEIVTNDLAKSIIEFLETKDTYLDADFSLQDLSEALFVNRIELSEVINRELKTNFYTLVAQYRIQNAKQLLCDRQNLLIEGVMQEVGFNSKITFNKYFKNFVGMTPSEFRRQNMEANTILG
ncbi:helix-turn-helix domain-containing protein [Myroides sp. M-43]|uniref:AraC family transcriptional regulator n=1 Tax=Myroides oncorhynchi TaxID=2893756 RepID=UPI001E32A9D3|nr:helix-turn-helix domain-containing protein [Myroides oncorhynchi]MCC9041289.1 helix-turn-helix domain-containing protein [Myroides oncorhynchi]